VDLIGHKVQVISGTSDEENSFFFKVTMDYVRLGLLGQLAQRMQRGKLFAVEIKPELIADQVYTWVKDNNRQSFIVKKQVYSTTSTWVDS
jgi:hypothetical protein